MKRLTKGFHSRYESKKGFAEFRGVKFTESYGEKNMRIQSSRMIPWLFAATVVLTFLVMAAAASDGEPSKIELESGIYYTVKKGDTLWDISNRYFNTHWRWPQIWSENQQIMNPNLIFPGERLRLYHQVWDASISPELKEQPESPSLDQVPVIESRYYVYSAIHGIGFVKEQPVAVSGQVAQVRADKLFQKTILGQDENIYITPSGNTLLKVGEIYAVYRQPMPVKDPESKNIFGVSMNIIGFQYYKTGLIRIVESREEYAVAKIEKSFRSIMVNDLLLPYEPLSSKIRLIPGTRDIDGKILMDEEGNEMFGDNAVAYINRGSEDGIQTGQTYAIYDEYTIGSALDAVDFGSLLILHTEATTSTVLILRSDRSIQPPVKFRSLSTS